MLRFLFETAISSGQSLFISGEGQGSAQNTIRPHCGGDVPLLAVEMNMFFIRQQV